MTFGTKQHRIPAAVIGRFGERAQSGRWRKATIQVVDLPSGQSRLSKAEDEGWQRGAFDYSDGGTADELWNDTETRIGPAVDAVRDFALESLAAGAPVEPADGMSLLKAATVVRNYIADITVRSAGFDQALAARRYSKDAIQTLREQLVPERRSDYGDDTRDLIILISPATGSKRLILSGYGWVALRGAETGLLVPLRPDLAVTLRTRQRLDAGLEVADLRPHVAEARKAMALATPSPATSGPRCVYAHPEDDLSDVLPEYG